MVEIYESEQEQVEALKRWWSENAVSVIAGVVIGVGGLFGWYGWQGHVQQQQEEASSIYLNLMQGLEENEVSNIPANADSLVSDYAGTHYASLGQLAAARVEEEAGNTAGAAARLQWVLENGKTSGYEYVARLRLAQLKMAAGDIAAARSVLDVAFPESFDARLNEVLGDIAVAEGDVNTARLAYDKALNAKNKPGNVRLIQMKRDDLGNVDLLGS